LNDIVLKDVRIQKSDPILSGIIVPFTFEGKKKLREWTKTHVGQQIAIIINSKVIMAPYVREEFEGPITIIFEENKEVEKVLKRISKL